MHNFIWSYFSILVTPFAYILLYPSTKKKDINVLILTHFLFTGECMQIIWWRAFTSICEYTNDSINCMLKCVPRNPVYGFAELFVFELPIRDSPCIIYDERAGCLTTLFEPSKIIFFLLSHSDHYNCIPHPMAWFMLKLRDVGSASPMRSPQRVISPDWIAMKTHRQWINIYYIP